jgi:hypothetical protein
VLSRELTEVWYGVDSAVWKVWSGTDEEDGVWIAVGGRAGVVSVLGRGRSSGSDSTHTARRMADTSAFLLFLSTGMTCSLIPK